MENHKIINLLNDSSNQSSICSTKKWYAIYDQNNKNYVEGKTDGSSIRFKTKIIKSNLCGYSDVHILETSNVTVRVAGANIPVAFKIFASLNKCRTHLNDVPVDAAENIDVIMSIYNFIEHIGN